ncbi:hypothetical protein PFAS1_15710 [Pseudomonas frederiksbergensis]|nr:hypothetical protein PFAS1_15710 [Pseudomonas frederiksbergensis]
MIVPTLRVGMPHRTLCVRLWDAERPWLHSHAERGNDQNAECQPSVAREPLPPDRAGAPVRSARKIFDKY